MIGLLRFVLAVRASPFKSKLRHEAENTALRLQLIVSRRKLRGRVQLATAIASSWSSFIADFRPFFKFLLSSVPRRSSAGTDLAFAAIGAGSHERRVCAEFLKSYADYYNGVRRHRSLNKDAPVSRPVQWTGIISSHAILGGLHHQYVRV